MNLFKIPFLVLIMGLNANGSTSANFEEDRLMALNDSQKNQELLRKLNQGQAVISKALVAQENGAFCYIDLKNREDLLPSFAKPAPANFKSSISFSDEIQKCSEEEINHLSSYTDHFVLEGTQLAFTPAHLLFFIGANLISGGVGCLLRHFQHPESRLSYTISNNLALTTNLIIVSGVFLAIGQEISKETSTSRPLRRCAYDDERPGWIYSLQ